MYVSVYFKHSSPPNWKLCISFMPGDPYKRASCQCATRLVIWQNVTDQNESATVLFILKELCSTVLYMRRLAVCLLPRFTGKHIYCTTGSLEWQNLYRWLHHKCNVMCKAYTLSVLCILCIYIDVVSNSLSNFLVQNSVSALSYDVIPYFV